MESKLDNVTILFTDLVDSTKYKQVNGHSKGLTRILKSLKLSKAVILKNNGNVIKNTGDGLLSHFANPIDAIKSAIEIRKDVRSNREASNMEIKIRFAITVGLIEIIELENLIDIFGTPIDKCARILSLAKPNQILIDASVYDLVESHLKDISVAVSEAVECNLKNYKGIFVREIAQTEAGFKGVEVRKYPEFVLRNQHLVCDKCGLEITSDHIETSAAILIFDQVSDEGTGVTTINDVHFAHKVSCDVYPGGWRDISEFTIPELYLDLLLTMINTTNNGTEKYSEKAKKKLYSMFYRLFPYVFRESNQKEKEEFSMVKEMLNFGL